MIHRGVTKILTFKYTVMTISLLFVVNKLGLNYTMWKFENTNTRSIPYIIQKNQILEEEMKTSVLDVVKKNQINKAIIILKGVENSDWLIPILKIVLPGCPKKLILI